MKKKLFLILSLAIAICAIFAISASAKTVTNLDGTEIEVTTYTDFTMPTNIQYSIDDVVIFDDGFACPSAYVFKDSKSIAGQNAGDFYLAFDFSYIDTKTGKQYTFANVSEVDIPQGVTSVGRRICQEVKTIKKVSFPNSVTSIGVATFQNASNLKECILEHDANSSLTSFPSYMFYGCSSLTSFSMPDCVTSMTGAAHFSQCSSITAIYLSANLETIECGSQNAASFDGCKKMYFVGEAFDYDNVPAKPTVYYFPENLGNLPNECVFRGCNSLNDVLVFDKATTAVTSNWTFQGSPANTVVFLGDMTALDTSNWGISKIIFANPNDKSSTDIATYANVKTAVFCASESDISKHLESPRGAVVVEATCYSLESTTKFCFCGTQIGETTLTPDSMIAHVYVDDFDCTTPNRCKQFTNCESELTAEATAHVETHDISFEDGFTSAGVHNTYCSNSTCTALNASEALGAMFTPNGYSHKENGSDGISAQFKINTYALKLYEKYEQALHFGIIIANANHFASADVFIENGELSSVNASGNKSGIMVEMSSREYEYFNCLISGFDSSNEQHTSLGLVIAGYVYGDNESNITYIQKQYTTDSDDSTTETPYVDTITRDSTLGIVKINTVKTFVPIANTSEEE